MKCVLDSAASTFAKGSEEQKQLEAEGFTFDPLPYAHAKDKVMITNKPEIELNTIEDLVALIKRVNCAVIVQRPLLGETLPEVTIYNSWVE